MRRSTIRHLSRTSKPIVPGGRLTIWMLQGACAVASLSFSPGKGTFGEDPLEERKQKTGVAIEHQQRAASHSHSMK